MPGVDPSTVLARGRVGDKLKSLRLQAGVTQKVAGQRIRKNRDRVSNLERGAVWPEARELQQLLDLYDAGTEARVELETMIREARATEEKWWKPYSRYVDEALITFVAHEDAATKEYGYSPQAVHGLLQTPAYARAIFDRMALEWGQERADAMYQIRLGRQGVIARSKNRLDLDVVLTEGSLLAQVGGRDAMLEQLEHLLRLAKRPNINIRVLPFEAGAPLVTEEGVTVMQFAGKDVNDVAFLETALGSLLREKQTAVRAARRTFDYVAEAALDGNSSEALIRRVLKEM